MKNNDNNKLTEEEIAKIELELIKELQEEEKQPNKNYKYKIQSHLILKEINKIFDALKSNISFNKETQGELIKFEKNFSISEANFNSIKKNYLDFTNKTEQDFSENNSKLYKAINNEIVDFKQNKSYTKLIKRVKLLNETILKLENKINPQLENKINSQLNQKLENKINSQLNQKLENINLKLNQEPEKENITLVKKTTSILSNIIKQIINFLKKEPKENNTSLSTSTSQKEYIEPKSYLTTAEEKKSSFSKGLVSKNIKFKSHVATEQYKRSLAEGSIIKR